MKVEEEKAPEGEVDADESTSEAPTEETKDSQTEDKKAEASDNKKES